MSEEQTFRKIYSDLLTHGKETSPRGKLVKEIENYSYVLPPRVRFINFAARKLNLPYIKKEFLWYLRANKYDLEILEHASMWKGLVNGKRINSNYGQYIFNASFTGCSQFENVLNILGSDKDSRRASMTILNSSHLLDTESKDVPCTYALNFRIRENKLKMTVHMRSQDSVFGMGNDAPCFSLIHEMVYVAVRDAYYPYLEMGEYHHFADSFHLYERHFKMAEEIVNGSEFTPIIAPEIKNFEEVKFLIKWIHLTGYVDLEKCSYQDQETLNYMKLNPELQVFINEHLKNYEFSRWLTTF
jgi:thymidylate synthase